MTGLYGHQEDGVELLLKWERVEHFGVRGGILSFDMGLGKTRTMLELIYRKKVMMQAIDEKETTLVVCPSGAISVWMKDIEKFYTNKLSYKVMHSAYLNKTRPEELSQEEIDLYDIIITSYGQVSSQFAIADTRSYIVRPNSMSPIELCLYKASELDQIHESTGVKYKIITTFKTPDPDPTNYTPIYSYPWTRVVADESTKFCGKVTMIGKAMIAINARSGNAFGSYFCLTGTPIANYETDLYNMFRFLGLVLNKKEWNVNRYRQLSLDSRVLHKKYTDTDIVLPKLYYHTVTIVLSDLEKEMYNKVVDKLVNVVNLFKLGSKTYAAPLEMFLRLRQICVCAAIIGFNNDEGEGDDDSTVCECKLEGLFDDDATVEYVRDKDNYLCYSKIREAINIAMAKYREGKKIIIFSSFAMVLDVLKACLESFEIPVLKLDGKVATQKRVKLQETFSKDPRYNIFLSTYKAGGLAIDLTAASEVILMEPWWNLSTEEQAIARAHRIGQKNPVSVYSLIAQPSYETSLLKIQQRKENIKREYFEKHSPKYKKLEDRAVVREIIDGIVRDARNYKI